MDEQTAQTEATEAPVSDSGQVVEESEPTPSEAGSEAPTTPSSENVDEQGRMIPIPQDKWRETQRQAREYEKLMASIESQSSNQENAGAPLDGYPEDAQLAINAIVDAMEARIAPKFSYLEKAERDQAIVEVGNRPFATELADEIGRNYNAPEMRSLSPRERMHRAYEMAVGKNIDRLLSQATSQAQDTGYNAAYQKIAEKTAAQPTSGGANSPRDTGSVLDRVGEMSKSDYEKNRAQIFREMGLGEPGR